MSISTNIISTTSTKTIKIRHGRNEDLDAIEDIVSKVVKMMNADGNFQWDEVYPLRCHFAQDIIDGNCYVAEEISIENDEGVIRSSRILGMAALTEDQSPEYADVGWDLSIPSVVMHRAAVCPSAQRSGIGSLFFNKSEELARERGYHVVR